MFSGESHHPQSRNSCSDSSSSFRPKDNFQPSENFGARIAPPSSSSVHSNLNKNSDQSGQGSVPSIPLHYIILASVPIVPPYLKKLITEALLNGIKQNALIFPGFIT